MTTDDLTRPPTTEELIEAVHRRMSSLLGRMDKLEVTVAQSRLAIVQQQNDVLLALQDVQATIKALMVGSA